jgi:hypothetical protein
MLRGEPLASGIKIECEYAMLMEICCRRNDTAPGAPLPAASEDA